MEIPENTNVRETKTGYFWFDEDGILYSVPKENPPNLSKEEQRQETERFIEEFGKEKRCMLLDVKNARQSSSAEQAEATKILQELTKAMAVIVHNPLGRMIINVYLGLQKPAFPMKIFKPGEEKEAKEWLRQYL